MATSASQPYIARLGFQDPDRSKDRHGLACEYLYERLIELEVAPLLLKWQCQSLRSIIQSSAKENQYARMELIRLNSEADSQWIRKKREEMTTEANSTYDQHERAKAELAILESSDGVEYAREQRKPSDSINVPIKNGYSTVGFADVLLYSDKGILGEVKITRQPAEQVLQQINFYKSHLSSVKTTYILTDYDCSDLQRLTQGSDVKVYRLGQRFEQWLANRSTPTTPEL